MSILKMEKDIIDIELFELDPYKFWEHIYMKCISPRPICDCCNETIDDISEWISFRCKCQKYFHKQCVYNEFDVLECPGCKECKQIYTFAKFLCKYMDVDKYYKIYDKSVKDKSTKDKLKLYKLWFHTYSIYTPPFLKLYDYLENHNPYSTIEYLEEKKHNCRIECFDPAFTMEEDGMTYNTEKIDYYGKKVFVDLPEFKKRLQEYSYDLIGDDFPYKKNVVLCGGAVHKCLESRIKLEDTPKYANIDIFICDPDIKVLMKESKKVIKYFQDRHQKLINEIYHESSINNDNTSINNETTNDTNGGTNSGNFDDRNKNIYWIRKNSNILRLYIPGYNRIIQLVLFKNTIENIVCKFDFSHVQYVYDGQDILTTIMGLEYANYLVTIHNGYYDIHFPKRYQKAKQLKLCIALPMAESMTLNLPKDINIESWYPNYTDDINIIKQQMKCTSNIKSHYITENKPCRILYAKIPTDFSYNDQSNNEEEIMNFIEHETLLSTY